MLDKRGIKPEELPPAEDIKSVERQRQAIERKLNNQQRNFRKMSETCGGLFKSSAALTSSSCRIFISHAKIISLHLSHKIHIK